MLLGDSMLDAYVIIIVISSCIYPLIISFSNIGLLIDGQSLQALGLLSWCWCLPAGGLGCPRGEVRLHGSWLLVFGG